MDHLCCRVFHVLYDPALCLAGFSESAPWCLFVCLWWLLLLFERPPLFAFLPHLLVNLVYICGVSGDDDDDVAHFWSSSVVVAPVQCTVSASPWPRMYVSLCVCVCVLVSVYQWAPVCLVFIYEIHECFGLSCRIAYLQPRLSPFWPGFLVGCSSVVCSVLSAVGCWLASNGAKWWPPRCPLQPSQSSLMAFYLWHNFLLCLPLWPRCWLNDNPAKPNRKPNQNEPHTDSESNC